ncbi:hypothetical protein F0238_21620 [Vibrio coralliilyticus]|uniref:Phage recombination protein Bet n=1 Tax=Vibrio coralliilyticus TaxID=190893 RepID=A0AAP7DET5_9VIBR|nr:hypothetical protein [Vibrio coralliilyticus]NOJ25329.1 hypothetical protein [Vibrio coralliilyticus]
MSGSKQPNNVRKIDSANSLIIRMAENYGVNADKLLETLKATAFRQRSGLPAPTNEQMMALLIVADQYNLNPFTKEIYAYPDSNNGIVPVVGIDGWSRIVNSHRQYDGMEFRFSDSTFKPEGMDREVFEWIECIMYRKDRDRPIIIREYMDEIYRPPIQKMGTNGPYVRKGPWQTHTRRLARHKVVIQTARIALGYTGIYDEDEAERILENQGTYVGSNTPKSIEFESNPAANEQNALPKPHAQPELMQDLEQAEFKEIEGTQEHVPVEQPQAAKQEQNDIPSSNEFVKTKFGEIPRRNETMIRQMIEFTKQANAWETTLDSFEERYAGTISHEYALDELNKARKASINPESE